MKLTYLAQFESDDLNGWYAHVGIDIGEKPDNWMATITVGMPIRQVHRHFDSEEEATEWIKGRLSEFGVKPPDELTE